METRSRTWLVRNVRQVWDGEVRRWGSSRETVRSATLIPSLTSSPWMRGAPHRGVAVAMASDESLDLGVDGGPTSASAPRELRPVLATATPLPSQDGVGRHDDQRLSPARPDAGQPDPKEAIGRAQSGPRYASSVHGELLAQGEVLEGELVVAAAEEGQQTEHVE
jgi:hypothetical protein